MKGSNQDFISFLKNPRFDFEDDLTTPLKKLLHFLAFDLKLFVLYAVIIGILSFLSDDFKEILQTKGFTNYSILELLLFYVLLAPLIEELAFRLGLKLSRTNAAISFGFQFIFILVYFEIWPEALSYRIFTIVFIISIFFIALKSGRFLTILDKHFNFFVYYNILFFGILHATNYTFSNYHHYLYVPILIIPQLFLGAYFSYARVRYNFGYSLLFHVLHNAILISFTVTFFRGIN